MEKMLAWGLKFMRSRVFKVGLVGIVGLIVQTVVFELLGIYLKVLSPSTAVIAGGEVAILTNFALNHRISFSDRAHHDSLPVRLLKFHLVVAGSLFLQWLFIFTTEHLTSNVLLIHAAYFAGVAAGFATNYAGYHFIVWKHHHPHHEEAALE